MTQPDSGGRGPLEQSFSVNTVHGGDNPFDAGERRAHLDGTADRISKSARHRGILSCVLRSFPRGSIK